MQRLIAIIGIAIALTPNTSQGAELSGRELKPNSGVYTQSFDGAYSDEPVKAAERKISKKTEKIIKYMTRIGIDGAGVKTVTYFVNDRISDDRFRIAGGDYKGFSMQFSHKVAVPSTDKLQMRLSHEEMPHWEMTGGTRGLMIGYKFEW